MRRLGIQADFKKLTLFVEVLLLSGLLNILIHEMGHSIPVFLSGGQPIITIFKFEIYPEFGYADRLGAVGRVGAVYPFGEMPPDWVEGLTAFSGAGVTLFISLISASILVWRNPRGIIKYILFIAGLDFIDILTYSFLPLIGLPHRLIMGSNYAEPVEGLVQAGVSELAAQVFILVFCAINVFMLYKHVKKNPFKIFSREGK